MPYRGSGRLAQALCLMIKCPHCGVTVKASSLLWSSPWRPFACPKCGGRSRIVRPGGQISILALLSVVLGTAIVKFVGTPYEFLAAGAAIIFLWSLHVLLLARTAHLAPVLPKNPTHAA